MAVTTFERDGPFDAIEKPKGFARRFVDRYIEAQMRKAQRQVNAYLQNLDDTALRNLGYSDADITVIRQSNENISLMA